MLSLDTNSVLLLIMLNASLSLPPSRSLFLLAWDALQLVSLGSSEEGLCLYV